MILLVATILNFLAPALALAQEAPPSTDDPTWFDRFCRSSFWSALCWTKDGFQSDLTKLSDTFFGKLFKWIGQAYIFITKLFANLSYQVFDWVSGIFIKNTTGEWAITNNQGANRGAILAPVFLIAWNITKQWANVIIFIALIAAAVAYMLSLDEYKKLLLPILLAALLVNFSGLLVGFLIDIANVAMLTFLGPGTTASFGSGTIFATMENLWSGVSIFYENEGKNLEYFAHAVVFGMIFILMGLTTLIMSVLFMVRYVMLAILFIVAPLAFALRVLPLGMAQGVWTTWWSMLLKWSMAGVVAAFFTNLGIQMAQAMFSGNNIPPLTTQNIFATMAPFIMKSLIVIAFLLAGVYMAIRTSAMVTTILAGLGALATGALSLAGKAGGKTLRALAPPEWMDKFDRFKRSATDNKAVNFARDLWYGTGTSAARRQRLNQADMQKYANMEHLSNEQLAEYAPEQSARGAKATAVLQKRESISSIKQKDKQAALQNLLTRDNQFKPTDFTKQDYRAAELLIKPGDMEKKIGELESDETGRQKIAEQREILKKTTLLSPNELDRQAREQVVKKMIRQQAIAETLPHMSGNQIRGIDIDDITPTLVLSPEFAPHIKKFDTAELSKIEKIISDEVAKEWVKQIEDAEANENVNEIRRLNEVGKRITNLKMSIGRPITQPQKTASVVKPNPMDMEKLGQSSNSTSTASSQRPDEGIPAPASAYSSPQQPDVGVPPPIKK